MKILIAGSSGMIGSAVEPFLLSQGHEVVRLVRHSPDVNEVAWDPDAGFIDSNGLEGFDGVINLATMPWPSKWTESAKQSIRNNRLATNGLLAGNLANCKNKPKVLICSSGMGIYPSSGDQFINEDRTLGSNFLSRLQQDGEAVAMQASEAGIRVVNLRTPSVLGGNSLQLYTRRIGDGKQWSPWISRDELARIIHYILSTDEITGPVNPVSPHLLRNSEVITTMCNVLDCKPGMPMPAFVMRLMFGEMADALLLASRRIVPKKLLDAGYTFQYPDLESAVRHELSASKSRQ